MHPHLEKPIIREEMAETSAAALLKFAFSIARSKMRQNALWGAKLFEALTSKETSTG